MDNFGDLIKNLPVWPFTILAALIGILGVLYAQHRKSFRDSFSDFRSSFDADLQKLRNLQIIETGQVYEILNSAYPRHEDAYERFRRDLNAFDNFFLRRRWLAYRGEYPKPPELQEEDFRYRLCHYLSESLEEEEKMRKLAIKNIEKLIA